MSDSFFGRTDRMYCVLKNDQLLLHRQENDRTPNKVINLKGKEMVSFDEKINENVPFLGAKSKLFNDPKHGACVDLTWSNQYRDVKRYLVS